MIYRCSKCGYQTKQKSHFNNHINKTNPCSNEVVVFDKETWSQYAGNISNLQSFDDLNKLTKQQLIELVKSLS